MNTNPSTTPFQLPAGLPADQHVTYCIDVITRYRQELPELRRATTKLTQQKQKAEDAITYWKEKYQQEKTEREKLQKENGKLKKEIEKLTKTKNRYQVALFDHGNFKHQTETDKKAKGGQAGHTDTNREAYEDTTTWEHKRLFVKTCGHCAAPLSRVSATRQKTLVDIVLHPEVVKLILQSERQWCGKCRMEVYGRDARSLPFTEYGINTFMLVMILRYKSHASLTSIATVISISHGLTLSPSDVSNLLTQAKKHLRSKYHDLMQAVRKGDIMYNDETGWLVNGKKAWLWIMANEDVTVYYAAESRGKGIAEELYGNSNARSMHDGLTSYLNAIPRDKQLYCWAHILRFAHEEIVGEEKESEARLFTEALVQIYHSKRDHPDYSLSQLETVLRIELERLLSVTSDNEAIRNIQGRLTVQKEGLINGLLYTRDGTNNLAERELRPMVINRDISNGSNTYGGMETTAILGSIMQTIGRKETNVIPLLQTYLHEGITKSYPQYLHSSSFDDS